MSNPAAHRHVPRSISRATPVLILAAVLFALVTSAGAAPPTVSVSTTAPANGSTVSGAIAWTANASTGTSRVDFAIDGSVKWTESSGPWVYNGDGGTLDTTTLSNGSHTLAVTAYGPGKRTATDSVTVNVSNTTTAPPAPPAALAITTASPTTGTTVSGAIVWQANVTSGTAAKVDFAIDGATTYTDTSSPYVYGGGTLDTTTLANGSHTLTAKATASDGTTASTSVTVNVSNTVLAAPTVTTLPGITGTATVGQVLTASKGSWSGTPTAYAYQWQRCSSTGASCAPISGAGSSSYTLVSADQGATLRVTVTASNTGGSGTATSAASAVVQANNSAPAAGLGTALPSRLPMSSGAGGTYYVDGTNGSDSNSGSSASPWKTINKALATVPLAGSIIKVLPGTYSSVGTTYVINFNRAGSVTDPVTLEAQTPGSVVIANGNLSTWTLGGWVHDASGLRIQGLVFRVHASANLNQGADAILIQNSDRIEMYDNTFNEEGTEGPLVRGGMNSGQTADDVWFIDNVFRPSGTNPFAQVTGTGWSTDQYFGSKGSHWIYAGQYGSGSNWDISNGTRRVVIVNNVFVGSTAGRDIELGPQAQGSFVVNNTFYGNHSASVVGTNTGAVYAGGGVEFFTNSTYTQYQTSGTTVANNLFVDLDGHGAYGSGPNETGNVVKSNMSYNLRNGSGYQGSTSLDYEPVYDGAATLFSVGTNVADANPLFTNASGYDYHLQSGSPALGKADPAYAYPYDADGKARSSAPAVGAFQ